MSKALKDARDSVTVMKIDNRDHYTIIRSMVKEDDPVTQAALQFISTLTGLIFKAGGKRGGR